MKLNQTFKRVFSGLLSTVMILFAFPNIPVYATTGTTVYTYDGYEVSYSVTNEWNGGQNVSVTITNTGSDPILNWALKYDAEGSITNLYNAVIYDSFETQYVVKNNNWNFEIAPNQSVNFGYDLYEDSFSVPAEFELCSERTNISSGYEAVVNYTGTWDTGVRGEITINNTSDEPLEAWNLSFDTNFTIDNVWDGRLLISDNNHYTISSEMWTNPIAIDASITIGFVGTKSLDNEPLINNFTLTSVKHIYDFNKPYSTGMYLYSDTKEVLGNQGSQDFIFYCATTDIVPSISLVDFTTSKIVAELVDDGRYALSGDDMKGDGVYTGKVSFDTNVDEKTILTFYATADSMEVSNNVEITIVPPFTEQELSDMEYVDSIIDSILEEYIAPDTITKGPQDYVQNGSNKDFNYTEFYINKCNAISSALSSLLSMGKIKDYIYNDAERLFHCHYSNGIPFIIVPTDLLDTDYLDTDELVLPNDKDYSGYNAVVINAFEDKNYRKKFYEKFTDNWKNEGMSVDYDDNVTVTELATKLSNKDIIALCGHGMVSNGQSVFVLMDDDVTAAKDIAYNLDLTANRIEGAQYTVGGIKYHTYIVYSDFFTHHYGTSGLDGSFIFSESCNFMGNEDNIGHDETFANALIGCAAESVIGFENSVMADYSRELMLYYFEELLSGKTSNESFSNAKIEYGQNDYEYRKPGFLTYLAKYIIFEDAFESMGNTAFPYLVGNKDAVLYKEIRNGDWELFAQALTANPCKWEYDGDCRVITSQGDIKPTGSRMAFISTGIGSKSGVSMSGSQGSVLYQSVRNIDKNNLEFDYDFISEEPMEYVGSRYDDKFEVQILDKDNNLLYSNVLESVNSSKWYSVGGIDFEEGDSTVFHTDWKNISIDISSFKNKTLIIKFLVYDVGDSAYDSAVVLDNIKLT